MRNAAIAVIGFFLLAGCASTPPDLVAPTATSTAPMATASVSTAPVAPVASLAAGDHEFSLTHDGIDRTYLVHAPPDLAPTPAAAVIVALHGGGGSAAQHQGQIELDPVADREGFLVVYPDGVGVGALHTWNAGPYCCGLAARTDVDDVGFIAAVLDDLAARTGFDDERVVVAGHSNGAMMASRFAAERPERVGAVVAVGAVAVPDQVPPVAVPMLQIHSVDDPRALYEGGEGPPFPGTDSTVVHVAVTETLSAWAVANGCSSAPVVADPVVADDGHTVTRLEWTGCVASLVHLRLTGAGHGWPGSSVRSEAIVGPETDVVHASEELWSFARSVLPTP